MKMQSEQTNIDAIGKAIDDVTKDLFTSEVQKLIDVIRNTMEDEKVTASYNLAQSIEPLVINEAEIDIMMDDYWKFVNYGVKGKHDGYSEMGYAYKDKPPSARHFMRWNSFKQLSNERGFAYAIKWHVYMHGIKARKFIEKSLIKYENL